MYIYTCCFIFKLVFLTKCDFPSLLSSVADSLYSIISDFLVGFIQCPSSCPALLVFIWSSQSSAGSLKAVQHLVWFWVSHGWACPGNLRKMLCRSPTAMWDLKALLLSRIQYEISKFGFWTPCLGGNEMDLHEDGGNSVTCGMETCQAHTAEW